MPNVFVIFFNYKFHHSRIEVLKNYFAPRNPILYIYLISLVDDQNFPSQQLEAKKNEVGPRVDEVISKQNNWMRFVNTWRSKTKLKTASNVQGMLL